MAGAGLRPSELNAGEGERGHLLHEPWVPMHRSENNFAAQRGRRTIEKIPWSVLLFGLGAEAIQPGRDANTVCLPMPTNRRGERGERDEEALG